MPLNHHNTSPEHWTSPGRVPGEEGRLLAALRDVWGLGVPTRCAGCGVPDRGLCRACTRILWRELRPRVVPGIDIPVVAACSYGGMARRLLLAYKEQGRRELGPFLGAVLGGAISAAMTAMLTPARMLPVGVPSTRRSERARGFRHVEELILWARRHGQSANILPPGRLLVASAFRTDQVGLDRAARLRNAERIGMRRGVNCSRAPAGVLLVDDVLTTGASLRTGAERLHSAGFQVRIAIVLCVTSGSLTKQ